MVKLAAGDWLANDKNVSILVHQRDGVAIACGIQFEKGKTLTILPGIIPYSLAIAGDVKCVETDFNPEFELAHFQKLYLANN